jgi:hypothetical protein
MWYLIRWHSDCVLGSLPFCGGADGEMPTYNSLNSSTEWHFNEGMRPSRSLKNQAYTPGAFGIGDGFDSTSALVHKRFGVTSSSQINDYLLAPFHAEAQEH